MCQSAHSVASKLTARKMIFRTSKRVHPLSKEFRLAVEGCEAESFLPKPMAPAEKAP